MGMPPASGAIHRHYQMTRNARRQTGQPRYLHHERTKEGKAKAKIGQDKSRVYSLGAYLPVNALDAIQGREAFAHLRGTAEGGCSCVRYVCRPGCSGCRGWPRFQDEKRSFAAGRKTATGGGMAAGCSQQVRDIHLPGTSVAGQQRPRPAVRQLGSPGRYELSGRKQPQMRCRPVGHWCGHADPCWSSPWRRRPRVDRSTTKAQLQATRGTTRGGDGIRLGRKGEPRHTCKEPAGGWMASLAMWG